MNKLNVALVGYGYAGKTFHAPLINYLPQMVLHTVVSQNAARVKADWPEVNISATIEPCLVDPSIDLIVLATPNSSHFPLATSALKAGKHVVVDKPLAISAKEASALFALAQKQKRFLSVFQNRRWDADFLAVRHVLQSGVLGDLSSFQSKFDRFRPQRKDRWREQALEGSGLWYDLGSHLVDQAIFLFGNPDSLFADLLCQREGAGAVDYFHVTLRYDKMRVELAASSLVKGETPRFAIHGTTGSFIKFGLDSQEDWLKENIAPGKASWGQDLRPGLLYLDNAGQEKIVDNFYGDYPAYYRSVADSILTGKPPVITMEQATKVIEILEVACESSRIGQVISL